MSAYLGMDATTGLRITGRAHLAQSVTKIVTTSIGSRHRRRPFGSMIPNIIDAPANRATVLQLYAGIATALMAWEPRLTLHSVSIERVASQAGAYYVDVHGDAQFDGVQQAVRIAMPLSGTAQG